MQRQIVGEGLRPYEDLPNRFRRKAMVRELLKMVFPCLA